MQGGHFLQESTQSPKYKYYLYEIFLHGRQYSIPGLNAWLLSVDFEIWTIKSIFLLAIYGYGAGWSRVWGRLVDILIDLFRLVLIISNNNKANLRDLIAATGLARVTLNFDRWPPKTIGDIFTYLEAMCVIS